MKRGRLIFTCVVHGLVRTKRQDLQQQTRQRLFLNAGILPPDPENVGKSGFLSLSLMALKSKIRQNRGKKSEKTLEEFQKEKDLQRNRVYTLLSALTEKNIDVLEEISKWDEQLEPIVDMFVAAFANSNKAIKDGYDSQIKDYDHELNGYIKETACGKKHFFGTTEISQMFESATPELLRKIAGVITEHGCKDVQEWMQKSLWYREFELGRETERKLKREREWER